MTASPPGPAGAPRDRARRGVGRGLLTRARRLALRLGRTRRLTLGGRSYRVGAPFLPPPRLETGHEPWLDPVFAAALDLGPGAAVDVGVNRMQTLFRLLALDPDRPYLGFEPQPEAALAARDFARRNGLDHVRVVCAGLSEASGAAVLKLRAPGGFDDSASISDDRPERFYRGGRLLIPVLSGDAALEALGLGEVRLIKADVEGAELEVFRGLRRTLAAARPVLIFEVLNDWRDPPGDPALEAASRRRSERAAALSALLAEAGYRLFAARPEGLVPLERIERIVSDDLALCTYAAAPEAEADRFAGRAAARRG